MRRVSWDGFLNARDLGGLALTGGGSTRFGGFVRAGEPEKVTAAGWDAAYAAGVRTVVDLRNPEEVAAATPPPRRFAVRTVDLDDTADAAFWDEIGHLDATPFYYPPLLERKAHRVAAAVTAVAEASADGAVLFHCSAGRDRTGLVAILLLTLAGADPAAVADDYALSTPELAPEFAARGVPAQAPRIAARLAGLGADSEQAAVRAVFDGLHVPGYLRGAGVTGAHLDALRTGLRG